MKNRYSSKHPGPTTKQNKENIPSKMKNKKFRTIADKTESIEIACKKYT